MSKNEEIEEIEDDPLDRTLFQEPVFDDDDDYYLKCIKSVEGTNIVENMFLENRRFKYDEECCSNNNKNNLNNLGIKQLSNKRNYFLNGDIKNPKPKESSYAILFSNTFNKENFINTFKYEIPDIIKTIVRDSNSSLQNTKITFIEKYNENTKIHKSRTKEIYKVLDDKVVQTKFRFFQSDILYPLFTSTQKEIDLNSLVPFIDGNQYNTFVDVSFTTENLFFYLNLSKNLINIPNLPSYCFYEVLKRGEGVKIEQYVNNPVNTFNKSSHENMKENIKLLLKKYEKLLMILI
jgi:hypothetical protein